MGSLEVMDQSAMTQARLVRSPGTPGSGGSLKLKERSMSVPTRPASQAGNPIKGGEDTDSFGSESPRLEVAASETHCCQSVFKISLCRFVQAPLVQPMQGRREPACPTTTTYSLTPTYSLTTSHRCWFLLFWPHW